MQGRSGAMYCAGYLGKPQNQRSVANNNVDKDIMNNDNEDSTYDDDANNTNNDGEYK